MNLSLYIEDISSYVDSTSEYLLLTRLRLTIVSFNVLSITGNTDPPLIDQSISLLIDGSIALSSTTNANGAFRDRLTFDSTGTHSIAVRIDGSIFVQEATSSSKEINVNAKPTALFEYTPSNARANQEISYTDLSSDTDGDIVSWLWEIGNAYKSTSQNPVHSFTTGGEYEVSLVVTDSNGAESDPYTITVTISEATETSAWVTEITHPTEVIKEDKVSIAVSVDYNLPGELRLIVEVSDETDTLDSVSDTVSWRGSGEYTLEYTAPSTPGDYEYIVTVTYLADDIADISEGGTETFIIKVLPGD